MNLFFQWFISAISIAITAYIVPGVSVTMTGAIIAAVVLGALNLFIRPLLTILTLPITILTFGVFALFINALLVLLASALVPGFTIESFWSAFLCALVLSVVNWVFALWSRPVV